MAGSYRKSGIYIIGNIPWGTHLCQFYNDKKDLIEILVPYFKAGLENNEFCMWITSEPLQVDEAKAALSKEVLTLDNHIMNGQISILDYSEWYAKSGKFMSDEVLQGWVGKEKEALEKGFDGLRLAGNTFWLEENDYRDFNNYEATVASVISNYRMLAICPYSLEKCSSSNLIDAVSVHGLALVKKEDTWHLVENIKHDLTGARLTKELVATTTVVNDMLRGEVDDAETEKKVLDACLSATDSIYGMIGVINEQGKYDTTTYSSQTLNDCAFPEALAWKISRGMTIRGVWGWPMLHGEPLICNDLEAHPDRVGFPKGHVSLSSFLGVPIRRDGKVVGMVSVANKPGGYTVEDKDILVRLASIIAVSRQHRLAIVAANRKTAELEQLVNERTKQLQKDIIERKQAEEALRESEEKLRRMFESVTDGITVTDLNAIITEVNERVLEMHGFRSRDDLIGKSAFQFVAKHDHEKAVDNMQKTLEQEKINSIEYTLLKADGSEFPVELSASVLKDASGNPIGFIAITRDITQRKQMEAEKSELEQRAQLTSRLAAVGEMASGVAHEINNPLTTVIGFAHLLMKEDISEDIKSHVENITDGAQRIAGIVERLLNFTRPQERERKYININDVIKATLAMRAYEMETSNIKATTQLDPDLPLIIADGTLLQQVFLNIIINADTEMRLAHGRGNLFIKTETIGDSIRISFKDDGPGIAKENLEKIFDPFFTTRKVGEGTGLGLSICHGIITQYNGQIYAKSRLGRGATFVLELPVVTKAQQLEMAELPAEESRDVTGAKILIIDDEPRILRLMSILLRGEGYEIETLDNASDALDRLKNKTYDLILLDIKLRGISGIELYQHTKKIAESIAKSMVFITGDVEGAITRDFLSKTKAQYIIKPFDPEKLKKDIKRILAEKIQRLKV